ncbi:hypothetical protein EVA_14410 [gut metagenome]|uniref:Uncharacterized protein n=1 Tax=gut metagenome TaxID=749906 RepID=J9G6S6_9ZZZZ
MLGFFIYKADNLNKGIEYEKMDMDFRYAAGGADAAFAVV